MTQGEGTGAEGGSTEALEGGKATEGGYIHIMMSICLYMGIYLYIYMYI